MKDTRIVKYNVDFCYLGYKYKTGAIVIDLSNIDEMVGTVEAEWSQEYAEKHLVRVLSEATGINGGWSLPMVTILRSDFNQRLKTYNFTITSRLYKNLRRIHERPRK